MKVTISPTSVKIPPFGGTLGETLDSFLRRFDRAARWAVDPLHPNNAKVARQKELEMPLMLQDNLIGKAPEESEAFRETAYVSAQAFKKALKKAFPRSETAVSKADQRRAKALRYYETLSIGDPETGEWDCGVARRYLSHKPLRSLDR